MYNIVELIKDFYPFAKNRMKIASPPDIAFESDEVNAQNDLGKTAHYEPGTQTVSVYVDGRHAKDILRSLSHELVHHSQYLRGEFENAGETPPGYAQEDEHMREMEREAYEIGNMCFRDWEDKRKNYLKETNYYTKPLGGVKMSLKDWKNKELNMLMMEKFGYSPKELEEEVDAYIDLKGDYKTLQKELPEEEVNEEEEVEEEESTNPLSVDSRSKILDSLDEATLKSIIKEKVATFLEQHFKNVEKKENKNG